MDRTERVWRADYARAHAAIPADWVWTDEGCQGIDPAYAGEPPVRHYVQLQRVGYARGWM